MSKEDKGWSIRVSREDKGWRFRVRKLGFCNILGFMKVLGFENKGFETEHVFGKRLGF